MSRSDLARMIDEAATRGLFERAAVGQTGVRAEGVGDPHNQTLNVAVQWGAAGVVLLYAM